MSEDLTKLADLRREIAEKFDSIEKLIKQSDANSISILTDINYALSKLDEAVTKLRDRIG
jgi:hypothetical protein